MDNNCIHKMHNIFRAVVEFERALETTFGMNINELMLLCILANKESLLAGEIANEMGLTRSNASKVIASLERKGYLERRTCKHDSRCQRCSITAQGREQMEHVNCESFPPPPNLAAFINP